MKLTHQLILATILLAGFVISGRAQDALISDPALAAAIRETLQKPNGPLTQQDLLSLTNLDASRKRGLAWLPQ